MSSRKLEFAHHKTEKEVVNNRKSEPQEVSGVNELSRAVYSLRWEYV